MKTKVLLASAIGTAVLCESATCSSCKSEKDGGKLSEKAKVTISLNAVMAYKHDDLVERLQDKLGITKAQATVLFKDMKRFLYLCAVSDKSLAPTEVIDEAWHHFILFTKDYARFCQRFFGRMIHHFPHNRAKRLQGDRSSARRLNKAVRAVFRHKLSGNWGTVSKACNGCTNCAGSTNCQS